MGNFHCHLLRSVVVTMASVTGLSAGATGFPTNKTDVDMFRCYVAKGATFHPKVSGYSPTNAHALALMSMAAYLDAPEAAEMAKLIGFTTVEMLDASKIEWAELETYATPSGVDDMQIMSARAKALRHAAGKRMVARTFVLFAANEDMAVISYRGTDLSRNPLPNIMTDLDFGQVPFGGEGEVHSGFDGATRIIWEQLTRMLDSVDKAVPTYITGHSLGAGLGTLTAAHLYRLYEEFSRQARQNPSLTWDRPYAQGLYTYGSSRVGDQDFVDGVQARMSRIQDMSIGNNNPVRTQPTELFPKGRSILAAPVSARVVNGQDIITRVPDPFFYKHLEGVKYFADDGTFYQDHDAKKKLRWSDNAITNLFDFKWNEAEDHKIHNYVEWTYRQLHFGAPSGCL